MILDLILGGGWKIILGIGGAIAALLVWTNRKQEGVREARRDQEIANGRAAMDRARSDAEVVRGGAAAARERLRQHAPK